MKNLMVRILVVVMLATLSACSTWFGEEEETLPGERISVLALNDTGLSPAGAGAVVELSAPETVEAWPQNEGNSGNRPPHASFPGTLEVAWTTAAGRSETSYSRILSQPVSDGQRMFVLDGESRVVALAGGPARLVWSRNLRPGEEHVDASLGGGLALSEGVLFVTTPYGDLVALRAEDGGTLWERSYTIPFRGAPTVRSGRVYAVLASDRIVVLNADDGGDLWSHEDSVLQGPALLASAPPAATDDVVVVPYSAGEIVAYRADNGRVLWRDSLVRGDALGGIGITDVAAGPVIDGDMVIASSSGGWTAAFVLQTGDSLWELPAPLEITPRVAGDWIFVLTAAGQVACIARLTGLVRWVTNLREVTGADEEDEQLWSGLLVAQGQVVVAGDRQVLALDSRDGTLLTRTALSDEVASAPVASGGLLYVWTRDGTLIALR